jgi:hypothetical protein
MLANTVVVDSNAHKSNDAMCERRPASARARPVRLRGDARLDAAGEYQPQDAIVVFSTLIAMGVAAHALVNFTSGFAGVGIVEICADIPVVAALYCLCGGTSGDWFRGRWAALQAGSRQGSRRRSCRVPISSPGPGAVSRRSEHQHVAVADRNCLLP